MYAFSSGTAEDMITAHAVCRTVNPKSNYTPMYCIAGGLALAGYVLNAWIAPGFIAKAGLRLEGNGVGINLAGRKKHLSPALSKGEGGVE